MLKKKATGLDLAPPDVAVTAATGKEKKPPCRFTLWVRLRPDAGFTFRFSDDPYSMCIRGDKYEGEDVAKMLKYLLGIVKNRHRSYVFMHLFDNAKPAETGEKLVLKIHHGEVKKNALHQYAELLKNFHLPEYLSYEVKD